MLHYWNTYKKLSRMDIFIEGKGLLINNTEQFSPKAVPIESTNKHKTLYLLGVVVVIF